MSYDAHSTAIVGENARIGDNTRIWHWTHVRDGAEIGADCTLGQNVYIAPTAVVGNGVKIQNNVSVYDGVILEDDVFCGPSAVFTNVGMPRSHIDRSEDFETTIVERGATVGANATVICGNRLGRYCFVGAGAVVTSDVPAFALVVGNPARQLGWSCRCGERLPNPSPRTRCVRCAAGYRLEGDRLELVDPPD